MSLTLEEQEVHVSFGRLDDRAYIYTSDTRYINKFNKIVAKPDSEWKLEKEGRLKNGELIGVTYSCPIELISFRMKKIKLTEKQKAERVKHLHRK